MFIKSSNELEIKMIEGDFGIVLPIEIEGITISNDDELSFKIFENINEVPIISKTYNNISDNTINFKLTKEESQLLKVGYYFYDIDWYKGESFLGNLVAKETLSVLEKAGA